MFEYGDGDGDGDGDGNGNGKCMLSIKVFNGITFNALNLIEVDV
jgi:hypothetical protein